MTGLTLLQAVLLLLTAGYGVVVHGLPPAAAMALLAAAALALAVERWGPVRQAALLRDLAGLAALGLVVALWRTPAAAGTGLAVAVISLVCPGGVALLLPLATASVLVLAHAEQPALAPALAAAILGPLLVLALGAEAWLAGGAGARRGVRRRTGGSWRRWVLAPAALAVALGLVLGLPLVTRPIEEQPVLRPDFSPVPKRQGHGGGLSSTLAIGTLAAIDPDPRVAARLSFTDTPPRLPRVIYLRAQALSRCTVEGAFVRWSASGEPLRPLPPPAAPAGEPLAWLSRDAGGGDAVWLPDGARWVGLDALQRDGERNWYRPGLGRERRTYAVSCGSLLSDDGGPAESGAVAAGRRYPAELSHLPWEGIEDRAWAVLPPRQAASAIADALADRCTYALEDLPDPEAVPAGALRQFLFSADASRRIGHCQYFATAACLLLRRAGHSARCVVGFASEEADPRGVTFRALHAHAWVEVVDEVGRWRRCDPTPAGGFISRQAALAAYDPAALPPPPAAPITTPEGTVPPPPPSRPWLLALGPALLGVALVAVRVLRRHAQGPGGSDRVQARQQEELVACAKSLGIRVTPRMTLSALVAALTKRTGVDLQAYLAAHLRARYGAGPTPPPWPVERLQAAAGTGRA